MLMEKTLLFDTKASGADVWLGHNHISRHHPTFCCSPSSRLSNGQLKKFKNLNCFNLFSTGNGTTGICLFHSNR